MRDDMAEGRIGVIMAGGIGERFWPVSRPDRPKQLLPLGPGHRTLLEDTVHRLDGVIADELMLIVTGRPLRQPIIDSPVSLPQAQVIAEPARRNTMGAVAWASAWAMGRLGCDEECVLAFIPADQFVGDLESFRTAIELALCAAERHDALVTVGLRPTRPETGYGYIEVDEDRPLPLDGPGAEDRLWAVTRFREKPNAETAEDFFRSGQFWWNGGMFFWRLSTFFAELERADEKLAELIRGMAGALAGGDEAGAEELFGELPAISVDYALLEHARNVAVVRGDFPWDDLGSWDAWWRVGDRDERGNATHGGPLLIDCADCAVYGQLEVPVAVVGMDGVVVVAGEDGVLVTPVERAQQVRDVVRELRERGGGRGESEG